jgi:hypothetical protein
VVHRPPGVGAFQFVVLSALRTAQLLRGCRPRVDGTHKAIVTAQFEVAEGKVTQLTEAVALIGQPAGERPVEHDQIDV